jgi:hypothetical protein
VNSWNEERINSVINSIYSTSWDPTNGGFFVEVNEDGSVYNSNKIGGDYYSLINLYLAMSKEFDNGSYISYAESLIPYLLKYYRSPGGYVDDLSSDWSESSGTSYVSSTSSLIMDTYLSLFEYTNNQTYLDEALRIRDFINTYFLDETYWGYHIRLTSSKSPDYGYWRVPGYYGLYYSALYHLFTLTNNNTYLQEGLEGLNKTIEIAFDFDKNFLHAYMNGQNTQWVSEFQIHQQIDFLFPLLHFLNLENDLVIPYKSFFTEIFNKISDKLFSYGFSLQNLVVHTFDADGKVTDSTAYVTRQMMVTELLYTMKLYDSLISLYQEDFLSSATSNYAQFFDSKVNAFFRSPEYRKFDPWVNWVMLKNIIQTNLIGTGEETSSKPSVISTISGDSSSTDEVSTSSKFPRITTTNGFYFGFLLFPLILISIFSLERRKKK